MEDAHEEDEVTATEKPSAMSERDEDDDPDRLAESGEPSVERKEAVLDTAEESGDWSHEDDGTGWLERILVRPNPWVLGIGSSVIATLIAAQLLAPSWLPILGSSDTPDTVPGDEVEVASADGEAESDAASDPTPPHDVGEGTETPAPPEATRPASEHRDHVLGSLKDELDILGGLSDPAAAAARAKERLQGEGDDTDAWLILAEARLAIDDLEGAAEAAERLLELGVRGHALELQARIAQAEEELGRALQLVRLSLAGGDLARSYRTQASILHDLDDIRGAIESAREFDRLDASGNGRSFLAFYLADDGQLDAAAREAEKAANATRTKYTSGILGFVHEELGNTKVALDAYDQSLSLDPTFSWAAKRRVRLTQESESDGAALAWLDDNIDPLPVNEAIELWETYGELLGNAKRDEDAAEVFEQLLDHDPDDPSFYVELADALRGESVKKALAHYETAAELSPDWSVPNERIGDLYHGELDDPRRAVVEFEAAAQKTDSWAEPWSDLGQVRMELENYAGAKEAFERAISINEDWVYPRRRLAVLLRDGFDDFEGAQEQFEAALVIDGSDKYALADYGRTLKDAGRYEDALMYLDRAVEADPTWSQPRTTRAWTFFRQGRLLDAVEEAEHALDLVEHHNRSASRPKALSSAHTDIGVFLGELRRWSEAVEAHLAAVDFNPESARSWRSLGDGLHGLTDYVSAVKAYDRARRAADARRLFEDDSNTFRFIYRFRAISLMKLENYAAAAEAFSKDLRRNPGGVSALVGRAVALRGLDLTDDRPEALLDEAIRRSPTETVSALDDFAEASSPADDDDVRPLVRFGLVSSAIDAYEAAIEDDPHNRQFPIGLASLFRREGRLDDALQILDRATRVDPGNGPYYVTERAWLRYYHRDDLAEDKWTTHFESSLRELETQWPTHPQVEATKGYLVLDNLGRTPQAAEVLREAVTHEENPQRADHLDWLHWMVFYRNDAISRAEFLELLRVEVDARELPSDVLGFYLLVPGSSKDDQIQPDEATEALKAADEAIVASPNLDRAYAVKGAALVELGRLDDAVAAFRHAHERSGDILDHPRGDRTPIGYDQVTRIGTEAATINDPRTAVNAAHLLADALAEHPETLAEELLTISDALEANDLRTEALEVLDLIESSSRQHV